ncbi:Indole-3-glycerol phosphate synthase [bioreactor metagenome]|uniref:indole-3-glycerol-phosphate synthase n=1 Tax=bioreactor metagenome TaxID=1076179 RepID=A0A644W0S8_9ZZZZ|nr:indole-3-glycerol phosphate synthase TrpC [Negativicutes bacterium]
MLETIVAQKRIEVNQLKTMRPLVEWFNEIKQGGFAFGKALEAGWSLIAECKLTSPFKGSLCQGYSVLELAELYTMNGATALSVHTDRHFHGKLEDIGIVKNISSLPVLRKDFIVDKYQIYEARHAGADAILLIAAILTSRQLAEYLAIGHDLGLDCLVEVHTADELDMVHKTAAKLIGINNRDLRTFRTDIKNTFKLAEYFDPTKTYISESGIRRGYEAAQLKKLGVRGILVGEGLVTASDIPGRIRELAVHKERLQ